MAIQLKQLWQENRSEIIHRGRYVLSRRCLFVWYRTFFLFAWNAAVCLLYRTLLYVFTAGKSSKDTSQPPWLIPSAWPNCHIFSVRGNKHACVRLDFTPVTVISIFLFFSERGNYQLITDTIQPNRVRCLISERIWGGLSKIKNMDTPQNLCRPFKFGITGSYNVTNTKLHEWNLLKCICQCCN